MSEEERREFAFTSAALSDVGTVRSLNEDSFVLRDDIGLWAVADGVGGHQGGDMASRTLAEALGSLGRPNGGRSFLSAVEGAILSSHERIQRHAAIAAGRPPGSTVACLVAYRGFAACLWVGDSRIYRIRSSAIKQLSKDHSVVQELVDAGGLSPEEARRHPQSNVITRAVGLARGDEIDSVRTPLEDGDRFLLCSDGLTGVLPDETVLELLKTWAASAAVKALTDAALSRGARDNVTAVVVDAVSVDAGSPA